MGVGGQRDCPMTMTQCSGWMNGASSSQPSLLSNPAWAPCLVLPPQTCPQVRGWGEPAVLGLTSTLSPPLACRHIFGTVWGVYELNHLKLTHENTRLRILPPHACPQRMAGLLTQATQDRKHTSGSCMLTVATVNICTTLWSSLRPFKSISHQLISVWSPGVGGWGSDSEN